MNETRFGRILENAARLAGRQVSVLGVPDNWKALAELAIASGIRTLAAEKFPMLQRVEYRRYRPGWSVTTSYSEGMEVWHNGAYWRRMAGGVSPEPGVGAGWRKLEKGEVWAFINWDQNWEKTGIDPAGVDANAFAYEADPKYNPRATPVKVTGVFEYGIELDAATAPDGVFVKFVPIYPTISFTDWVTGTAYEAGDMVYRSTTKDVYQCQQTVAQQYRAVAPEADEVGNWVPVRIAADFESYLTLLSAAVLLTEDQGKYQTRATAENELERLRERFHEGVGGCRVRTGRFR